MIQEVDAQADEIRRLKRDPARVTEERDILGVQSRGLAGSGLRVTVVEPRLEYEDDRTWSFFRTRPDPFAACVRAGWSKWHVSSGGVKVPRTSDRLRDESVSSGAFYRLALARNKALVEVTTFGAQIPDISEHRRWPDSEIAQLTRGWACPTAR